MYLYFVLSKSHELKLCKIYYQLLKIILMQPYKLTKLPNGARSVLTKTNIQLN